MLEINKIYKGDCLEVMKSIDNKSIDLILCDLPYNVTARNEWDILIPFRPLWGIYERIIKDNGAIILTATQPFATQLISSNYKLFRYDLIWEKPLATGFLNANKMPLRSHESILIFYKSLPIYNPQMEYGKPYKTIKRSDTTNYKKNKIPYTIINESGKRFPKSVIRFPQNRKTTYHPTQKPVALFEYLIKTYTNEGDLVLDNCAGSGTTGVACRNWNRNFILIEKDETYCKIAEKRISVPKQIRMLYI